MRAKRKQKRVFQHQSRTAIPPETIQNEDYDTYKYDYSNYMSNNEDISTTPRGDLRSQYI